MRTTARAIVFSVVVVLLSSGGGAQSSRVSARYMAICVDGDGDISGWVTSRYEAYLAGRDHERVARGHNWEIMVQQGETPPQRDVSCAIVSPGKRQGTMVVENICTECRIFRVSRKAGNEPAREKNITFQAGASRTFRTMEGARFGVIEERLCSGE